MIEYNEFRLWLADNKQLAHRTIGDIICRLKRINDILPWEYGDYYIFCLTRSEGFKKLSTSVRSQCKRSISLYNEYLDSKK